MKLLSLVFFSRLALRYCNQILVKRGKLPEHVQVKVLFEQREEAAFSKLPDEQECRNPELNKQ